MSEKCVMCSWDGNELYAMCALHQEIFDQRKEIERLRAALRECSSALDHISRRGGFSDELGWLDIVVLRDKAARAAGGKDE